jgi:SAM-dependent methyltransferase
MKNNIGRLFIRDFVAKSLGSLEQGYGILDLGCGEGPYGEHYHNRAGFAVAADRAHRGKGADVLLDAHALPFRDSVFDVVLSVEVVEHLLDPDRAVGEISRVLKPGGSLLVTWPLIFGMHEVPWDFQRFTEFGMARLLRRHGLEPVSLVRRGDLIAVLVHLVGEIIGKLSYVMRKPPVVGRLLTPLAWVIDKIVELLHRVTYAFMKRSARCHPTQVGEGLTGGKGFLARWMLGYCCLARKNGGSGNGRSVA